MDHVPGPIDATQFLRELLDEYRQQIARWEAGDDDLVEAWAPHCYLTDRAIVVETGGKRLSGRCLGISSAGALRLLTADGPIECTSGVIVAMDAR